MVVIDASPDFRWVLRKVLQRKGGFDVVADCDDLASGLDAARACQPNVVLVEVDDPRGDAAAIIRELRMSCPHSILVATMSIGRQDLRDAVLAAGGAGAVRKDVSLEHTFSQLWSVLRTSTASADARLQTIGD